MTNTALFWLALLVCLLVTGCVLVTGRPMRDLQVRIIKSLDDFTSSEWEFRPSWSTDGRRLAVVRRDDASGSLEWCMVELAVLLEADQPLRAGQLLRIDAKHAGYVTWHPDGKQLAYDLYSEAMGWQVYLYSIAHGTSERLQPCGGELAHPAFSPDGSRLACIAVRRNPADGSQHYRLVIRHLTTNNETFVQTAPGICVLHPRWSPDGSRIAYEHIRSANAPRFLRIVDLRLGSDVPLLHCGQRSQFDASWSPDGRHIAFVVASAQGLLDLNSLLVVDTRTGAWHQLSGESAVYQGLCSEIAWNPVENLFVARQVDGLVLARLVLPHE